jgi:hypothetical protein
MTPHTTLAAQPASTTQLLDHHSELIVLWPDNLSVANSLCRPPTIRGLEDGTPELGSEASLAQG